MLNNIKVVNYNVKIDINKINKKNLLIKKN